jgi:hypothetical protein
MVGKGRWQAAAAVGAERKGEANFKKESCVAAVGAEKNETN